MELRGNPQLVAAFRRGDRDVLADLYRAHVDEIRRVLQRGFTFTSRGETVRFRGFHEPFRLQEVLQEAFIHAFREKARQAYDEAQPYRPFLVTIVRNYVIDRYRKKQTEAALFVQIGDVAAEGESPQEALDRFTPHDETATPELAAFRTQLSEALRSFVDELDEEDSIVLQKHMLGDLTQSQVAEAIGTHRNDVRKRIRTMRERLLRHLKRQGFIDELDPSELFES
jgi:RNA polymerase sigma factor (sigma-70 family)